jgi:hypothetical protein
VHAFAAGMSVLNDALCRIRAELDPCTTSDLLPEWEHALGLPDPCMPTARTDDERRQRIMVRLSKRRWTTAPDWIDLAAMLGLRIKITPGWHVQAPQLFGYCFPAGYDLFPKLGRFRVYIDILERDFDGYEYGSAGVKSGGWPTSGGWPDKGGWPVVTYAPRPLTGGWPKSGGWPTSGGWPGVTYAKPHSGYPIPFGETDAQIIAFMCLIERVCPANVVVVWNEFPDTCGNARPATD